ncbi:putative 4-alpha-glucanotransferase DPE2 [Paratrimastix pyriformis]|uniref:4-alpha-glucanotransferase n=1 Tax=Paratrimastix pyriformis TaxID=342808 RepID=A0ABQ8UQA7_9EUKA|nr:putative 4-alpha-glucanotransferase DPE2 [Paratrimastix pyriformis]
MSPPSKQLGHFGKLRLLVTPSVIPSLKVGSRMATEVKIQLIRHATVILEHHGHRLMIDPMLSPPEVYDTLASAGPFASRRNPLVPLPVPVESLLNTDAVFISHDHNDHFDVFAKEHLPHETNMIAPSRDVRTYQKLGFNRILGVTDEAAVPVPIPGCEVDVVTTGGKHGSGLVGKMMGKVAGFVMRFGPAAGPRLTVYIAGDSIWCPEVDAALKQYHPDIVLLNAGAAKLNMGDPITMTDGDVLNVLAAVPATTKVVPIHMEVLNHCRLTRAALIEITFSLIVKNSGLLRFCIKGSRLAEDWSKCLTISLAKLQESSDVFIGSHEFRFDTPLPGESAASLRASSPLFHFKFVSVNPDGHERWEDGQNHVITFKQDIDSIWVSSQWLFEQAATPCSSDAWFSRSAFRDVIFGSRADNPVCTQVPGYFGTSPAVELRFSVACTRISPSHDVVVYGEHSALGDYKSLDQAIVMSAQGSFPTFHAAVRIPAPPCPNCGTPGPHHHFQTLRYKYVIRDRADGRFDPVYEGDYNFHRTLLIPCVCSLPAAPPTETQAAPQICTPPTSPRQDTLPELPAPDQPIPIHADVPSSAPSLPPAVRVAEVYGTAGIFRWPADRPLAAWRGAGVIMPVFALRSAKSMGVGDFMDIPLLVDWCVQARLQMIQARLIPAPAPAPASLSLGPFFISPSRYPYSSLSVFALHPLYLRLDPALLGLDVTPAQAAALAQAQARLEPPGGPMRPVDYEDVLRTKLDLCAQLFRPHRAAFLRSEAFRAFDAANGAWLRPYAVFCHLRDRYDTPRWAAWGAPDKEMGVEALVSRDGDPERCATEEGLFDVGLTYFIQFQLHRQFGYASQYARAHGVAIKGDIAIGVNPDSVDVWQHPELFRREYSTGAPPDAFSDKAGQNWGFPPYDWEAMARTGYAWWRARLQHMAQYFHASRIDHVLGFFRVWVIPRGNLTGMLGRFLPSFPLARWELDQYGIWDVRRLCRPHVAASALRSALAASCGDALCELLLRYYFVGDPACPDPPSRDLAALEGPGQPIAPELYFRGCFQTEQHVAGALLHPASPLGVRVREHLTRRYLLNIVQYRVLPQTKLADLAADQPSAPQQPQPLALQAIAEEPAPAAPTTPTPALPVLEGVLERVNSLASPQECGRFVAEQLGRIEELLLGLFTNRVLLEDAADPERMYHPRFGMLTQESFQTLPDGEWRQVLGHLYHSYYLHRQAAGILCLRIQRMKAGTQEEGPFYDLASLPYDCVCSPSTHDQPVLRAWYEDELDDRLRDYFCRHLCGLQEAPRQCTPAVVQAVVRSHMHSPAMWATFLLSDLLGMDPVLRHPDPRAEQINNPAVNPHYWRYRMHVGLEALIDRPAFAAAVRQLVVEGGRHGCYFAKGEPDSPDRRRPVAPVAQHWAWH